MLPLLFPLLFELVTLVFLQEIKNKKKQLIMNIFFIDIFLNVQIYGFKLSKFLLENDFSVMHSSKLCYFYTPWDKKNYYAFRR